jgi:Ca2+-binding RTX toxin-like protein
MSLALTGTASLIEGGTASYAVMLNGIGLGAGQSVTFTIDAASGTATEVADFAKLASGALIHGAGITLSSISTDGTTGAVTVTATNTSGSDIAIGSTLASVSLPTMTDTIVEGVESFTVSLTSAAVVSGSPVTTSITDMSNLVFSVTGDTSAAEGTQAHYAVGYTGSLANGQTASVHVTTANGTAVSSVDFSNLTDSGASYDEATGILTFSAGGATSVNFTVDVKADTIVEGTENYTVNLTGPSANATVGTPTVTTSIADMSPMLVIGSGVDDKGNGVAGTADDHVISNPLGDIDGAMVGGNGNDILVGDPGGSSLKAGASANIALVLDTSGSMATQIPFGSTTESRLVALKAAVIDTLHHLYDSGAANVVVHIDQFNTLASSVGTFKLTTNGVDSASQLTAAINAVNALTAQNNTNYEAGLQNSLNWINSTGASAPIANADVNKLVFISDGAPNTALQGNGTTSAQSVTADAAIQSILGTYNPTGTTNDDTVSEVSAILGKGFGIEAVGINVSSSALSLLSQVEGVAGHTADNITNATDLSTVVGTLTGSQVIQTAAGSDEINGGLGNDIIFGDSVNTDALAAAHGLTTPAGAGWLVFETLEGNGSYSWTRADTVNYIQTHQTELAAESGRTGGNDVINGGGGDDRIYGQEGDDIIAGGSGNDILSGGTGADTFVWHLADVTIGTTTDKITDANTGDSLNLSDLINDGSTLKVDGVAWDGTTSLTVSGTTPHTLAATSADGQHIQMIEINFADTASHTLTDTGGVVKIG